MRFPRTLLKGVLEERAPGLLLQAIPYLGQKKILKVFTPHLGVISLITKKKQESALLTPFCLAEWVYRKGRNDLYLLLDGSISEGLLGLRKTYETLSSAGLIAKDLIHRQMPGAFSAELFALTSLIFQKMGSFEHPEVLVALFRLKWLQHEGLLSLSNCSLCELEAISLHEGESYCALHGKNARWLFTKEEWAQLRELYTARTFSHLKNLKPLASLYPKIGLLFEERVAR